jgi:thymidylate kinase
VIVCISGIDGSGKTSIIEALGKELQETGQPSRYVWLRYNHYLTKFLLAFCRLTGLTRHEYPDGLRLGYHEFHRSRVVSWIFVLLTYLDTLAASIVRVYLPTAFGSKLLVCDRWIIDIMIDLEIDTRMRFAADSRLERLFRGLLPAQSRCFLITRSPDAVEHCRPENRRDRNFQRRLDLYQEYSTRKWVTTVQNNSSVREAVASLCDHIRLGGSSQ